MQNTSIQANQPLFSYNNKSESTTPLKIIMGINGSNNSQPTSNQHERVTLYLGIPAKDKIVETDLLSAFGGYLHRIGEKDLAQYPLVFSSREGFDQFCKIREQIPNISDTPPPRGSNDESVGRAFVYALHHVPVYCADDFDFKSNQKIYITGHGTSGSGQLQIDGKMFSMNEVAQNLHKIGVSKDIRDIRLTSCDSADAKSVNNLKESDLNKYSSSYNEKVTLLGFTLSEKNTMAPAQHLAYALHENGFNHATVTGYHGKGIYTSKNNYPEHFLRNPNLPTDSEFKHDNTVRRSEVKEKFTSDID